MSNNLKNLAKQIARENNFKIHKEIYRGFYYSTEKVRNIIYDGNYQGKEAVLKVYDDPRLSDEPAAQNTFNAVNKSRILLAPKIYKFQMISPKRGWLIMERLPGGHFMSSPLPKTERVNFLKLYLEYRENNPKQPTRTLTLAENLPAPEFHIFRISRWLQLANDQEEEIVKNGGKAALDPKKFIPYFEKSLAIIRQEFSGRGMVWCHGHFKPHEIYVAAEHRYYLTDFAHSKMYPEGYELAFIIWADWIMSADWRLSYEEWHKGVFGWLEEMNLVVKKLKIKNFKSLMRASLVERIMGAILADVCATDRPRNEKIKRVKLLYKLWDEILM